MPGIPAAILYLRDIFGGDFTETESDFTAGTAAQRILQNDPERISLTIINLSANNVYIKPANTVSATSGILLTASGGSVSMDVRSDATLPTREWWAVAAAAGSDLFILSLRRYATFPNVG